MNLRHLPIILAWAGGLLAAPAWADTSQVSPTGFTSSFREEVQATPAAAWQAITQLPRWWSDAHTWSGSAANMSLAGQAGGCWCERWSDAAGQAHSVMHGQVVLLQPGRVMRLFANLGPLQELPVQGVLTLVTGVTEGRTLLRLTYRVAGPPDAGLEKLAPAVDQVLAEQFRRLKALAENR
jgi:uncharacterized protein YndB with AHSA1/START domain